MSFHLNGTFIGNVLGKIGAQALVASIQRTLGEVHGLKVSLINCDCQQEDSTLFDASNPGGKYKVLNVDETSACIDRKMHLCLPLSSSLLFFSLLLFLSLFLSIYLSLSHTPLSISYSLFLSLSHCQSLSLFFFRLSVSHSPHLSN